MNLAESLKASDLLVKALENEGIQFVFGVPGEENLDFVESLRNSYIKLIVTRHEQTGGFMAATVGRLTGTAGVCLATLGPGATNLATCAAYAFLGAFPMLMITGQKPVLKSKQGAFQIIETTSMFRPVCKWTKQLVHGGLVPSYVREAMRRANEERPGTCHIELPEDVAREKVDDAECMIYAVSRVRRPIAEDKAIAKTIELLKGARHPLLILGAGANRKMTSNMLRKFVNATGIPFCTTQMGKGVVDSRHDSFVGTAALSDGDYVHAAILHSDVCLLIGHDVVEKPPFFMSANSRKIVVHINYSSAQVDQVYFPQLEVVGDISNTIWQLSEAIPEAQPSWDLRYFKYVKGEMEADFAKDTDNDSFPMAMPRLVRTVREAVPDHDSIVALDNGLYKVWFAREYPCYAPNSLLLDNALATMGAGVPSAMAAKLVKPEANVFCIVGDGGFLMNGSQELLTAIQHDLHITILILNDQCYGMIRWKQEGMGLQDYGLGLQNPDFMKLADAYGARGHRVQSADDLERVLKDCQAEKAVHVVEVPINYDASERRLQEKMLRKQLAKELKSPAQILGTDHTDPNSQTSSGGEPVAADPQRGPAEEDPGGRPLDALSEPEPGTLKEGQREQGGAEGKGDGDQGDTAFFLAAAAKKPDQ
jgi:acetolactate synthase-1/2/3 large subunit